MIARLGRLANAVTWKRGHWSSGKDNGRKALTSRRRKFITWPPMTVQRAFNGKWLSRLGPACIGGGWEIVLSNLLVCPASHLGQFL